jgi:TetR/AcrR family transcriptional repressor of nem operon
MDLLNTKGYHATTMNDIINATGVQKGNIYYHFQCKEALVADLVRSAGKAYGEYLSERAGNGTPVERLCGILDGILDYHRGRNLKGGCLFGNLAMETVDTVPAVAESVKKVMNSAIDWFTEIITMAVSQKTDCTCRIEPRSMATRIVAATEGAILLARLANDISILENAVRTLKAELIQVLE